MVLRRPWSVAGLRDSVFEGSSAGSLQSLLIHLGPFVEEDAFAFGNSYELTAAQLTRLSTVVVDEAREAAIDAALGTVNDALESLSIPIPLAPDISLPGFIIDTVVAATRPVIALAVADLIGSMLDFQLPGPGGGRCGGMAFAAYDLYLQARPPDPTMRQTPQDGPLADYIFDRLIDSLALNAEKFMDWMVDLHVLPAIGQVVTSSLLNAAGGPLGSGIALLVGGSPDIFHFGGKASLLRRTKAEWQSIRRVLSEEPACPIGLIFANNRNPLDQHQILAVGHTSHPPTLNAWDNKKGQVIDTVNLDFSGDELKASGFKGVVAGFFLEDYSPQVPPAF